MLAPLRGKHANDRCLPTTENANNMGGPTTWWSGRAATGSHTIRVQPRITGTDTGEVSPGASTASKNEAYPEGGKQKKAVSEPGDGLIQNAQDRT